MAKKSDPEKRPRKRRKIPVDIKALLLIQCGYRCGNPNCRSTLTIELHHIEQVSDGGDNGLDNLLPLCPYCHELHHKGYIPRDALQAWKSLLDSLNTPTRNLVDLLIVLYREPESVEMPTGNVVETNRNPVGVPFVFSGDSLPAVAGTINAGLLEIHSKSWNTNFFGGASPTFQLRLTSKGRALVKHWLDGNRQGIQQILSSDPVGP